MKVLNLATFRNCLVAVFCLSIATHTRGADLDFTVVPGKQVGGIHKATTLAELKKSYGPDKVKDTSLPGVEGEMIRGAVILAGTNREMHVIWNPDMPGKEVFHIDLIGKDWQVGKSLRLGSTLSDVEKANGGPFKVSGFEWDLGGYADFTGGALEAKLMVRFVPTVDTLPDAVLGDIQFPSSSKVLRGVKPVVQSISVILR